MTSLQHLTANQVRFADLFIRSCRHSILEMVTEAQSGHPGGSLSSLDFLVVLYLFRVAHSDEKVVVSNGHISPAVYAIMAELGYYSREEVIKNFRKAESIFEGHVNRHVHGVHFGTGPLGVGASAGAGFALSSQLRKEEAFSFLVMGDGENQEGQIWEMMNFANKHKLKNLIAFIDYNEVQLSASLEEILPLNLKASYEASGWHVIELDGHDVQALWMAIQEAMTQEKPTLLLGKTVMGKGVAFMEETGLQKKADWHGKTPSHEKTAEVRDSVMLSPEEQTELASFVQALKPQISPNHFPVLGSAMAIDTAPVRVYSAETLTDCRSAYGQALVDLAEKNPEILALTADLAGSVKTDMLQKVFPERHIECGIAEQHMLSLSGALSLDGWVPFCSTFGAFMTSRAKDQARVNDINECNVKMVATHCGLSVGEDGPTHQAIDDISSFQGFFNTSIFEPADPNQCDRIIRYIASHYGNFYVRMGRAKVAVLTKENGQPYFDENYRFEPGKVEKLRSGSKATVLVAGPMSQEALKAWESSEEKFDLFLASDMKVMESEALVESIARTKKVLVAQDHHAEGALASLTRKFIQEKALQTELEILAVPAYQLSGTAQELYRLAKLDAKAIFESL